MERMAVVDTGGDHQSTTMPRPSIPRPNENHPGTGQIRPDPGPRRTGTRCIGAGGKRMPGAGPRRKGPSRPRLPGPGRGTDWPRGEHTVYSYASCMQTRTGTDTAHTDPVAVLLILYSHVRTRGAFVATPTESFRIHSWELWGLHRKWTREGTCLDYHKVPSFFTLSSSH